MPDRSKLRLKFIEQCQWQDAQIIPLVPDASFRQYFRLNRDSESAMLMDAPPSLEDATAFIKITHHLLSLGISAPQILFADENNGFVLLRDLGNDTFTELFNQGKPEAPLYAQAIETLISLHNNPKTCEIDIDEYALDAVLSECELFTQWYLPATQNVSMDDELSQSFCKIIKQLFLELPDLPPTLVLRDYHVDNLMRVDGKNAVLDYQDALIGSPAYDVVSLLEDARRDISDQLRNQMLDYYLAARPDIDTEQFQLHYDFWGTQRHLKVAGIFVRLYVRDGKSVYLKHLDRVMNLFHQKLQKPNINPLKNWFHQNSIYSNHRPLKAL